MTISLCWNSGYMRNFRKDPCRRGFRSWSMNSMCLTTWLTSVSCMMGMNLLTLLLPVNMLEALTPLMLFQSRLWLMLTLMTPMKKLHVFRKGLGEITHAPHGIISCHSFIFCVPFFFLLVLFRNLCRKFPRHLSHRF